MIKGLHFVRIRRSGKPDRWYVYSRRGSPRSTERTEPAEQSPEVLPYLRFVEQKAQARRGSGGESSISGTHSDGVRDLLNRLSGARTSGFTSEDVVGEDWMDLGDEDRDTTLGKDVAEVEASEQQPADRNAFVKAVRQYEQAMAGGAGSRPVGGADVLRLRFWLMLLVHAARWKRYREGLPCTVDDFGWPRLAMRVLSTFFYGRAAPIVRLVVENAYLDLPVDFLETWATALWLVDLLPQALGRCHGRKEFLKRVPVLRQVHAAEDGTYPRGAGGARYEPCPERPRS